MKRIIILLSVFALLISSATFARPPLVHGKTYSDLGMYIISESSGLEMINGKALKSYEISYENSPITITVAIDNSDPHRINYLVISEGLVIQYISTSRGFGVSIIDKKFNEEGFSTSSEQLNKLEYFRQKRITQLLQSEIEYVKLISVFYPRLIENFRTALAII